LRRQYKDVEHFVELYCYYKTVFTSPQSLDYMRQQAYTTGMDDRARVDPPPYDVLADYEDTMRAIHARVCHPRRKNGERQWVAWGIARVKMGLNHGCYAAAQRTHNRMALEGAFSGQRTSALYVLDEADRNAPDHERSHKTIRNWVAEVDRIAEQVLSDRGMLQRNAPRLGQAQVAS